MPRPHRHSLSAPRRHDRRWPRRQIRRRLPCRRPLTLPDNRRRRSASPRPPLNEVHQSIAKLGATSTSRFPRPLQNTGSATRKDIKIRASNHIRKRGHAHFGLHHLIFNADPWRHLASATALLRFVVLRRARALVHAAGFDSRAALQPLQTGDLLALLLAMLLQRGKFTQQLDQQSFKLRTAQIRQGASGGHPLRRIAPAESEQEKIAPVPTVLPLLPVPPPRC